MQQFTSSMSPKGQITIPAEVRRRLRLKPKDLVSFIVDGDVVTIEPQVFTLESAAGSVPPLSPPRDWQEVERIAREEHVADIMRKMAAE